MQLQQLLDRATYNTLRLIPDSSLFITPQLRTLCIEPTNDCNLHCVTCPVRDRKIGYMTIDLYRKVLSEGSLLKPDNLYLSFQGESFLHPEIEQFLYLGYLSGIKNRYLFTNGTLVKPCLSAISTYLTSITFSLDGIGEVNNQIRIGCNYDLVKENIQALKMIRDETRSKLEIKVNLTRFTQTNSEIISFIKEMQPIVNSISVTECHNKDNQYLKNTSYGRTAKYCSFPLNSVAVLWDGTVSFCMLGSNETPLLDNINIKTSNLEELWKSNRWKQMRNNSFRLHHPPFKGCIKCERGKQHRIRFYQGNGEQK